MNDPPEPGAMSRADMALVGIARDIIRSRYRPDRHVVGAAIRVRGGRIFTGIHLETYVGRIAVCAEAVALGRAATETGETEIDTIVAVRHPTATQSCADIQVAAPCGMCREMISDYSPRATVILPDGAGGLLKKPISLLLPDKYTRG